MSIIKQFDKRSGITYVYESVSYWDKEKKQPRSKRTLIGRYDPETGETVPTDGRGKRRRQKQGGMSQAEKEEQPCAALSNVPVQAETDGQDEVQMEQATTQEPCPENCSHSAASPASALPASQAERLFFGATYLLDQIGKCTGVEADLKACFPDTYKQILSLAYYLILEDRTPLLRFRKWGRLHKHPYGRDIPSQRSTDVFQSITEESKMRFFRLQGKRRAEKEYWAYDSTSISSTSRLLKQVRYGKNKDGDGLAQINLALLFGEESGLPFYYRKIAGNIPDVKTLRELLRELDVLGCEKIKLVMDRGFYSAENINAMYKEHLKFLCGTSTALKYAKEFIREIGTAKDHYEHYNSSLELYTFTKTIAWDYEQLRPYKGDVVKEDRRMYLHLYFDPDRQAEDGKAFNRKMDTLKEELLSGHRVPGHEKDYRKYFEVRETPKRGISLMYKQDAIDAAHERYGFFALISNEVKDPVSALQLYKMRDVVENAFWDVKERLNMKRTLTSSESSLEGKLFVEFVALIYISYIRKKMEEEGLFAKYTMQELLDELDVIECFRAPGKAFVQGEVLKKQELLYQKLGVEPLLAEPKKGA